MRGLTYTTIIASALLLGMGCQSAQKNPLTEACSITNRECVAQCQGATLMNNNNLKTYVQPDSRTLCEINCSKKYDACMVRADRPQNKALNIKK